MAMDDGFDDFWDGPEWQDFMWIGPMAESIAKERREQERIQKEFEDEEEDVSSQGCYGSCHEAACGQDHLLPGPHVGAEETVQEYWVSGKCSWMNVVGC